MVPYQYKKNQRFQQGNRLTIRENQMHQRPSVSGSPITQSPTRQRCLKTKKIKLRQIDMWRGDLLPQRLHSKAVKILTLNHSQLGN